MSIFWYLLNLFLTWTYTDAAIIGWWRAGQGWIYTFFILLVASTVLVLANYGVLSGIFWVSRKFISPRIKNSRIVRFFKSWYSRWQKKPKLSVKWGKKIAKILDKHRHWRLFLLNLIPYVFYVSAATIAAAKFKKIPYAIWPILAGNAVKVLYMVGLVYTSPIWLSWFRDAFSYIVNKIL